MKLMMVGIFLGLSLGVLGCVKSESVPIGGECSERDNCVGREDCMKLPSGKGVCTKSCNPASDDCPAPIKCEMISLSVDVPGKTVEIPKIPRCMLPGAH